jgi:hypothetical protein
MRSSDSGSAFGLLMALVGLIAVGLWLATEGLKVLCGLFQRK